MFFFMETPKLIPVDIWAVSTFNCTKITIKDFKQIMKTVCSAN